MLQQLAAQGETPSDHSHRFARQEQKTELALLNEEKTCQDFVSLIDHIQSRKKEMRRDQRTWSGVPD